MVTRFSLYRYVTILLFACALLLGAVKDAKACTCLAPEVDVSYSQNSDVITGRVLASRVFGPQRLFLARVQRVFKGCLTQGEFVVLSTPRDSAACGATFRVGRNYLINGQRSPSLLGTTLQVSLCDYNVLTRELTATDREFLEGRMVCCGDECTCADGTQPVNCFVDPCEVAQSCPQGECVANYCGGCNAEFFDETGNQVCLPGECNVDDDCPVGSWCRGTNDGSSECAPFVGEGESCEGFTMPSDFERCEEPLVCDFPEVTQDIPGTCRSTCTGDADCAETAYCAADALCHDDGSCDVDDDCNTPGNEYIHILCTGHGICVEGQCGWQCATEEM